MIIRETEYGWYVRLSPYHDVSFIEKEMPLPEYTTGGIRPVK